MALIALACYDTLENNRTWMTKETIGCLEKTVNWDKHDIVCVSNNSCEETNLALESFCYRVNTFYRDGAATFINLPENQGTARAINLGWSRRKPGQNCVKIDNDVVIHSNTWLDEMEAAIAREPRIGIIGLKRKDLIECTTHEDPNWRSVLVQLPHKPGESWIQVELVRGVMGTCKMVNSKLIDKIGYLSQPTVYGFDDSLYSCRSELAGFINCFLPHINIDHIDPGGTDYTTWKQQHAGQVMEMAQKLIAEYQSGVRPIYEAP